MIQFIFGFPTTCTLSQEGISPFSERARPPMPPALLWKSSLKRFRERARASGHANAAPLWAEALSQVEQGWLCPPCAFPPNGDIPIFVHGAANAAFRFGVTQGEKLRACDDLRRNMVNLCALVMTPITLPTWGHLAQMAKQVPPSGFDWAFIKGDHASAYKQLPLDPRYANLTVVAPRNPSSGLWEAFVPRVLLFGAVSAVIDYNCFFRALAVLLTNISVSP